MKFQPGFEEYFLSPVTGRILESGLPNLLNNYIFIGSRINKAIQSPAIIDIRLELSKLKFRLNDTKFILQSHHDGFKKAQALDELDPGILKQTEGVISIAIAGTDYYSPGHPTYLIDTYAQETYNVSVGTNNFSSITSGTSNTALSDYALAAVTSGSNNTALGYKALYKITTGSHDTAIGYQAGSNQTNYNQCSFLGSGADASANNLTNAMALGYNASVGASNTIVLGNSSISTINVPGLNFSFTANTISSTNNNGNIVLSPNGTGAVQIKNGSNVTPLQFYNADGTNYVAFQAGSLTANTTWTLPTSDSSGTQALVSDGSGHLSWAAFMGTALEYKHIWIGNSDNIATPQPMITLDNEPDLTSGNIWRGNSMNRPEESADLSNLENRVTDLETRVTDLETRVTTIEGEISAIQGEIDAIQLEILAIQAQIEGIQLEIDGLLAAVALLQTQLLELTARVTALETIVNNLRLDTFVVGGPPDSTGLIHTSRGPTCLLTNIPAGGDVDLGNYRIFNLATFNPTDWYDMEAKQQDAINFLFLWQFFGGGTR